MQEGQQPADPDPFVEEVAELGVAVRADAGVVQRDDLPLVVEHRRARRAGFGVGFVVEELLEHVDDPVFPQGDLLLATLRVLDDRDEVADDRLAFGADQPAEPEGAQLVGGRFHRHEREVETFVGDEEAVRVEAERPHRPGQAVHPVLVVELDEAEPRGPGVRQHVVVGEQQFRRHQRAGAVPGEPAALVPDVHPADGGRSRHAAFEVTHAEQVVGEDDPFEDRARGGHRGRVAGGDRRGADRPHVGVVAAEPVDPGGHAARLVGEGDPALFPQQRDLRLPLPGPPRGAAFHGFLVFGRAFGLHVHDASPGGFSDDAETPR